MKIRKSIVKVISAALFPNRCANCDEMIPDGDCFCDYCFEMLSKTAVDKLCHVCGCEKENCQCKYHVFHFSGLASPFYNEGVAKNAMYRFKFRDKPYAVDFFAEQMCLSVKSIFYGIDFDTVVYVPLTLRKELQRGYNQSRELAVRIAKILNIPLTDNALGCKKKKSDQHKTNIKERFKNVSGIYYPRVSLLGKRVLLVDDIKTTGASLDECAKALFAAGAEEVYCVTAIVTKLQRKNDKGR